MRNNNDGFPYHRRTATAQRCKLLPTVFFDVKQNVLFSFKKSIYLIYFSVSFVQNSAKMCVSEIQIIVDIAAKFNLFVN